MNRRLFLALLPAIPAALSSLDLSTGPTMHVWNDITLLMPDITPLLVVPPEEWTRYPPIDMMARNRTHSTQPLTSDHVTLAYEQAFRLPTRVY